MTLISDDFALAEIDAPGRYANPNRENESYGDPDLHLPPVAETYAAKVSPVRREQLANKIASWFDSTFPDTTTRGAVRIIDIAQWMRVPLETLHDQRTIDLLESRGILKLKVPGLRYVFLYREIDGIPNLKILREVWSEYEIRTSSDDKPPGNQGFGNHARGMHKSSKEAALSIVAFLRANPGKEYTYKSIDHAVGIATTTIKRESFEATLKAMGVRIRKGDKQNSKRYYSVARRRATWRDGKKSNEPA